MHDEKKGEAVPRFCCIINFLLWKAEGDRSTISHMDMFDS